MLFFLWMAVLPGQNVPNGGFEDWELAGNNVYEPVYWQTNNMDDLTLVYQEAGHTGQFSAKISVEWDETLGMNMTPILFYQGYFPVSERFSALNFYMLGETLNDDYLMVNVGMYSNGILIGNSMTPVYDDHTDWTAVSAPITYGNEETPDECFISLTIWPAAEVDLGSYCFIDDLVLGAGSGPVTPVMLAAITNSAGTTFELNFNTAMADPAGAHNQFSGTHNGSPVSYTSAALKNGQPATIVLQLASAVLAGETLKVSYAAGTVASAAGVPLASFTNEDVTNLVGGTSGAWQVIPSGTEENLYCVHFGSSSVGYIGGGAGKCLKSVNGGLNWNPIAIPSAWELLTVYATDDNHVHIGVWDTIYNSSNGGSSWSGVYLNTVNYWVMDLQFHTQNVGYMFLQASAFKKTTDGGNSWSELAGSGVIDDYLAGYMIDETNGFAVGGAGLIAHTTDGGQTWPQYEWNNWTEWSPIDIEGVHFTSLMNGFAVADSGVLLRTTDGGGHWTKSYIAGPDDRLKDIWFVNANLGWIVGYHGKIFSTTDGGNTWNQAPVITSNDLNSVFFISSNLGWAVGSNGTILRFGDASSSTGENCHETAIGLKIFPNPCTSLVSLEMNLPGASDVQIDIFDLTGKNICRLFDGNLSGGSQVVRLNIQDLENGIYFCRVSGSFGYVCKSFMINR